MQFKIFKIFKKQQKNQKFIENYHYHANYAMNVFKTRDSKVVLYQL